MTTGAPKDGGMMTLEGCLDDMEVDSYLNNINNNDLILKLIIKYNVILNATSELIRCILDLCYFDVG